MKKLIKVITTLFIFTAFYFLAVPKVQAQTFTLSPATGSYRVGSTFAVNLNINTGGKEVSAADAKFTFDSDLVKIFDVVDGTFFPQVTHNIYSGTLYIGGNFVSEESNSGSGLVATIILEGKAAGTGNLSFVCTTQATDTNILDTSAESVDIINCSGTTGGSYTFTGTGTTTTSSSTTNSSSTLSTGETTPSPEPPVTGITLPTVLSFGFGLALITLGFLFAF